MNHNGTVSDPIDRSFVCILYCCGTERINSIHFLNDKSRSLSKRCCTKETEGGKANVDNVKALHIVVVPALPHGIVGDAANSVFWVKLSDVANLQKVSF